MKRYIRAAQNYTTLAELKNLLKNAGIDATSYYQIEFRNSDMEEVGRFPITLSSGNAEFVVKANYGRRYFDIIKDGVSIMHAPLKQLFERGSRDNITYSHLCKSKDGFVDKDKVEKKYASGKVKEIKQLPLNELMEYVTNRDVPDKIAKDALRQFTYQVNDEDWLSCYSSGGWVMTLLDTKVENWASIGMQAYGYHYTYTVQLDTRVNTYTTTVRNTEGWHTE